MFPDQSECSGPCCSVATRTRIAAPNLITFFPPVLREGQTAQVSVGSTIFFVLFSEQKTARPARSASTAVAVIDTPAFPATYELMHGHDDSR